MKPIFLIGYMGCGKSTLGRALASATGRQFIDLDFYISQRFRKSIHTLFEERGEDGFRRLEQSMLREVGEFDDTIIACGGGTPCHFDNMGYMKDRGLTIWLQADRQRLLNRLVLGASKRPLLAGKNREEIAEIMDRMLTERRQWYSQAAMTIDSTYLENTSEIASTLAALLPGLPTL